VQAVAKGAALLKTFSPLDSSLSVRQLAERTGIPRTTTHALCRSLCDTGMLEQAQGGGYQLGPALVGLGGQVIDRTGLVSAAEGILERLPRLRGSEAHLGQLVDGWIVYLDRATSTGAHSVYMRNRVGLRAPAHRTGCGKAALACYDDPDEVAELVERVCAADRSDPPDWPALHAELDEARRNGCLVSGDYQPDRTSVAAPIQDFDGQPIGGVSLAGPTSLFTKAVAPGLVDSVVTSAGEISEQLTSLRRTPLPASGNRPVG
jgi:DNA-binding IclR family transcriptional regulator